MYVSIVARKHVCEVDKVVVWMQLVSTAEQRRALKGPGNSSHSLLQQLLSDWPSSPCHAVDTDDLLTGDLTVIWPQFAYFKRIELGRYEITRWQWWWSSSLPISIIFCSRTSQPTNSPRMILLPIVVTVDTFISVNFRCRRWLSFVVLMWLRYSVVNSSALTNHCVALYRGSSIVFVGWSAMWAESDGFREC